MTYDDEGYGGWPYGTVTLLAPCIRCGRVFASDPETVDSLWVDTRTRCPVRPDRAPVQPGGADTVKEPLCPSCVPVVREAMGVRTPVHVLFPLARFDAFDEEGK